MHWTSLVAWLACIIEPLFAHSGAAYPSGRAVGVASDPHTDGSCTRVRTVVSWIPTWLHLRTRLTLALWGAVPLTHAEAVGFAPLAVRTSAPVCLLGAISLRLALELQRLEDMDAGHDPRGGNLAAVRADVFNRTGIVADWARVRKLGFKFVLQSGWPVFELLRRLQQHILPHRDAEPRISEGTWDSPCDEWIRPNDWQWIDWFPRETVLLPSSYRMKSLPNYELNKAVKDSIRDGTKVCSLAWATHYLIVGANIFLKPGMASEFFDDGEGEFPPPDDKGTWAFLLLQKASGYMRNIKVVLSSWWPALVVLGQLTGTSLLHHPFYAYYRPFITGLAGPPSDDWARAAIVEAGAHDGSDAVVFATQFPDVEIWTFEAHPTVYVALEARIQECGDSCSRVHTTECALGAADEGTVPFFINSPVDPNGTWDGTWGADSSSSLYRPAFNGSRFSTFQAEPVNVTAKSLRRFAAESGMDQYGTVRFLDLDAEGGEYDILRGVSESMLQGVYFMKLEVRDESKMLQGVPLFPEVREWLFARGFLLLFRSRGDALFVRRDLALI